tara:strand:- start:562 stop:735 length:174 start_codon:yes stop_codon:yes gene_type:complete
MIDAIIICLCIAFGFIVGAICAFTALVKALKKQEKELNEYRRLHKNKYDDDKDYNAY